MGWQPPAGEGWIRGEDGIYRRGPGAENGGKAPIRAQESALQSRKRAVGWTLFAAFVVLGLVLNQRDMAADDDAPTAACSNTLSAGCLSVEDGEGSVSADSDVYADDVSPTASPQATPVSTPPSPSIPPGLEAAFDVFVEKGLVPAGTPHGVCPSSAPQKWWIGAEANCWQMSTIPTPSTLTKPSTAPTFGSGVTICSDGWVSGSKGRGTCSHHGGVR